jgi:hypothetical protein
VLAKRFQSVQSRVVFEERQPDRERRPNGFRQPGRAFVSHNRSMGAVHVTLEIPEDLGSRIAADPGELSRAALEGLALEAIRAGKLTVPQARRLLGIPSRYEMDGFLKAHGLLLDLTLEDVRRDSEVARALPG